MTLANRQYNHREQQSLTRANFAAYTCVLGALVFVLIMGFWGLYRDLKLNHSTILQAVVSRLRAQATRRAVHLENGLERSEQATKLADLRDDPWLQQYWSGVTPLNEQQLYAAVVDVNGRIIFHTDPALEGQQLRRHWYDRVIDEVGDDVVESHENILASGRPSYDIQIPLIAHGQHLGEYYEGLKKSWIDERVAGSRHLILRRWSIVISAIIVIILLSVVSLYYLVRRSIGFRQAVALAHMQRVTEVGQLAAGLAHEIRNPLHAIRLNLHTLQRALGGHTELPPEEVEVLTRQSQEEVDRIDQLMRELLGYASPEQARNEDIDVCQELRATLEFLSNELRRANIEVTVALPKVPAMVRIDKTRFRQVVLNLLLNAKEVMPDGGTVHVSLRQLPASAEIVIADQGPGVPQQDCEKIFEPFYTTKASGTGFGLAIAKRFVTEAGGTVACVSNGHDGAKFRLTLPRGRRPKTAGA